MDYTRRIIDDTLDELLPYLPAIALEGAKGVGKTATANERAAIHINLADRRQRQVVAADPQYVTTAPRPTFIDEWQLVPDVWDVVKTSVDEDAASPHFLLAGSADPGRAARIHSGAGRIVRLAMRPQSFPERGIATPTVSFRDLLSGTSEPHGRTDLGVRDYTEEILQSGFPGFRGLPPRPLRAQLDSYIRRIVDHDLEENGIIVRRPEALLSWMTAYAGATATNASYTTILNAATPGEGMKPARQTVAGYREELTRLFILDPIPAWVPSMSPLKRLSQAPKHHLVDPALTARLTGATLESLIRGEGPTLGGADSTLLGALFESLVTQTARVLAESTESRTYHLRTQDGDHEVDLIIEAPDRRVLAIEVTLASTIVDADAKHLLWLKQIIGERLIDMVIVSTGPIAYRRPDGIAVVPLALLGP